MKPLSEISEETRSQRKHDNIKTLTLLGKWQSLEEIDAAGGKKSLLMESAEELIMFPSSTSH